MYKVQFFPKFQPVCLMQQCELHKFPFISMDLSCAKCMPSRFTTKREQQGTCRRPALPAVCRGFEACWLRSVAAETPCAVLTSAPELCATNYTLFREKGHLVSGAASRPENMAYCSKLSARRLYSLHTNNLQRPCLVT